MGQLDMKDAMLCMALALRIHGTNEAVLATAHRVRPLVRREIQPLITRIIRCPSAMRFIENFLLEL